MTPTLRGALRATLLAIAVSTGCALVLAPAPSRAQLIQPWSPAKSDSLMVWASQAREHFRANVGDSIGGSNLDAYVLVSRMARRMLQALGRENMPQATVMQAVFDSLGLEVSVAIDPAQPEFLLLMVRNPFRTKAEAVGFLFWYKGSELRSQGVAFRGGFDPRVCVWWTSDTTAPYKWAILHHAAYADSLTFTLLRMSPNGAFWSASQYEGEGPNLSLAYQATFLDINHDGRPELMAWATTPADSIFQECTSCPHLISELLYTEGPQGYELHDTRLIPSAYADFTLFIRLLRDSNRAAAARLLNDPSKLGEAIAHGWNTGSGRGLWKVEYTENERQWPTWFEVRFRGPKGDQKWIVHFTQKDSRWVIKDWLPLTRPAAGAAPGSR
jgi:hypothetical protein